MLRLWLFFSYKCYIFFILSLSLFLSMRCRLVLLSTFRRYHVSLCVSVYCIAVYVPIYLSGHLSVSCWLAGSVFSSSLISSLCLLPLDHFILHRFKFKIMYVYTSLSILNENSLSLSLPLCFCVWVFFFLTQFVRQKENEYTRVATIPTSTTTFKWNEMVKIDTVFACMPFLESLSFQFELRCIHISKKQILCTFLLFLVYARGFQYFFFAAFKAMDLILRFEKKKRNKLPHPFSSLLLLSICNWCHLNLLRFENIGLQ